MDDTLLLRFLLKCCSPAEVKQLEEWALSDKENADLLFDMEHLWQLKDEMRFSDSRKIEQAYRRFQSGIDKKDNRKTAERKKRFSILSFVKYVAVFILIALLSSNLYYWYKNDRMVGVMMNTVDVPKGQRASLTLSDGTKVWLNSQSKLTYPASFSKDTREVSLQGEAFFEVTHNREKPFLVRSSLLKVNVLGTKFNMKAYPEAATFVTLSEGSVEVITHNNEHKITLRPNQQVSYSETSGLVLTNNIDADLNKSWTIGELCFFNQPLSEIKKDLERRFNVNITIRDTILMNEIFTCRFKENITIGQILKNLKDTKLLDYKIRDRQIEIFKPVN